jgi:hypothetical protein
VPDLLGLVRRTMSEHPQKITFGEMRDMGG